MNKFTSALILLLLPISVCFGQRTKNIDSANKEPNEKTYHFKAIAELGFLGVFDHKIQFGENTTYFDYDEQGGQSTLFAVTRLSLELNFGKKSNNTFTLLYQPLSLKTQVVLREDIQIDDVTFLKGSSLNTTYDFPFYRLSYMRHVQFSGDRFKLALGASIQIRNATIVFESGDGSLRQASRNVGIVPLLKLRTSYQQSKNFLLELEADGIYAPISYLNGSDNEVVGALLDLSLRQHMRLTKNASTFLNLRYLGGGAEGTSDDTEDVSDGYNKNWLHFYTVSVGFAFQF